MKKVKVSKWKEKVSGEEYDGNTLKMLTILVNTQGENAPKGLDAFRLNGRLSKAFDKAEKTGILELEDGDYLFLRKLIEENVPSQWAFNRDITKAIEDFIKSGDNNAND